MVGIYKIENKTNGKCYIGQSINIQRRWRDHRKSLKAEKEKDYNYPLYRAMRKYGLSNFLFQVLEECDEGSLNEREIFWIKKNNSILPNGYNQLEGGNQNLSLSVITKKESEEIIDLLKISLLTQEEIANRYNITQSNVSRINTGDCWLKREENYPIRARNWRPVKKNFCADCGKEIEIVSLRCSVCRGIKDRRVERPSREEFKGLIRKMPFESIGKMFGVTGNAIRKWCIDYNLPKTKKEIKTYSDEKWEIV